MMPKFNLNLNKRVVISVSVILVVLVLGVGGYFGYQFLSNKFTDFDNRINKNLQQNKEIVDQLQKLYEAYAELKGKPTEVIRRETIRENSQDNQLTDAVSKVASAVVSIAITKDVPQLEVVYVNPFGNDPFFKDFDIRIPQYRQKGTTEQKVGAGSGFIISSNGYIITNRHVVDDQSVRYTVLLNNGSQKLATVVYKDNDIDIAILKIDGSNYPSIAMGNSDALKLGQSVFAVGNALGEYNNSVSVGIISGLNRDIEAFGGNKSEKLKGVIQTDAAINPGNSGGPLVNLNGEVVGVNVAYNQNAQNIGFSIPINSIKNIINSYVR